MFYATLVWAMFDRQEAGTLPRLTERNLAAAEAAVDAAHAGEADLPSRPVHERYAKAQAEAQPILFGKLRELIEEDVREAAMTEEVAATIWRPTQVAIEAFDAALSGRRPGERQGTIVNAAPTPGRNDACPCGSGKKYKKCHGAAA